MRTDAPSARRRRGVGWMTPRELTVLTCALVLAFASLSTTTVCGANDGARTTTATTATRRGSSSSSSSSGEAVSSEPSDDDGARLRERLLRTELPPTDLGGSGVRTEEDDGSGGAGYGVDGKDAVQSIPSSKSSARDEAIRDLLEEEGVDDRRRTTSRRGASSRTKSATDRRRKSAAAWVRSYVEGDAKNDAPGWDDAEAWFALGYARRYGLVGGTMDEKGAMECLTRAAELGSVAAHEELGFTYASGWDGTPRDGAKSALHYYFAASGGSVKAMMALGYRHKHGIDVPESCETSVLYYHEAAKIVVDDAAKRTPGVLPFQIEKHRLSAEMSGSNLAAKRERDLVQYYRYSADMGNVDAQVTMGRLYALGARGLQKDVEQARKYLSDAASAGDATAMANLGNMYANGFGVDVDNATALYWFKKAAKKGNAMGRYGLGYMTLAGQGVEQNHEVATQYLTQAADQGLPEARFFLGVLHLRGIGVRQDFTKAYHHFNIASHVGHEVATYNLAMMQLNGMGFPSSCSSANSLLKQLAERGAWATPMEHAYAAYMRRDYRGALLRYMKMAEMGLEIAQANAAFLLEHKLGDEGRFREDTQVNPEATSTATRALHYHRLAATQGNIKSLLRIGDAYYYGRGTVISLPKSIAAYRQASEQRNPHAMFNLAHMHEHGIGMQKDLHLAKRYYDMILTSSPDANVLVQIALRKLHLHQWIIDNKETILAVAKEFSSPSMQFLDFVITVGASALLVFVLAIRAGLGR